MKIITEDSLPRCFKNHPEASGLVYEDDIGIGSKLKLKLLVFHKPAHLKNFWRKGLGKPSLGKKCIGAVWSNSQKPCHFTTQSQTTAMSQEFHMSDPKDAIAVTSGCGCLLLSTLLWLAIGLLVVMALIKFVFG